MTPEQIEQLIRELMNTGELLATKGYALALQQVYVQIVHNFAWAIAATIALVFSVYVAKKAMKKKLEDRWSDWEYGAALGLVGTVISAAVLIVALSTAISYWMNPEWYAVQLLLKTFLP